MDNNNPFEDPDVQNTVNSTLPPPQDNAYGDDSNNQFGDDNNTNNTYEEQNTSTKPPPTPPQYGNVYENTDTAINVGSTVVGNETNQMKSELNEAQQNDSNEHAAPAPPTWCDKCMNWFPLQYFCLFGGMLVTAFAILDLVIPSNETTLIGYLIYIFLIVFGFIIMFIEAPSFRLTRARQIDLYFWFRLLSRLWGRGWFYIFVSLLCMGELDGKDVNFSGFAGIYLLIMAIITFIVSRAAAKKYQRCYVFIAAGTEGEERDKKFVDKFIELDGDQDNFLVSMDIVKMAQQAGRTLANAERHALQTFLDESCNGRVSREDFCKMYAKHNMKQRFL